MKLIFIIGTGRCGSTLVHEVLAKHEDLGFVSNIEDNFAFINRIGRWNNVLYRSVFGEFTRKGRIRFAPSEAFRLISREVSPVYANSFRDLTENDVTPWLKKSFRLFFERRAAAQKKPLFTHKYTGWPRIGFFSHIFPEAKFIHIVRDGRAVVNSWLQMKWWEGYRGPENWQWGMLEKKYQEEWKENGNSFHRLAAIGWKMLMETFHEAEKKLPQDRYFKLRFEDILEAPEDHFRQMLRFSGMEWNDRFDRHFRRKKFHKDRNLAFERDLNTSQVAEIEQCLWALLLRYGYK